MARRRPKKEFISNARDIKKFRRKKRLMTNSRHSFTSQRGKGAGGGGGTDRRAACHPGMCGPGECCVPGHVVYGERSGVGGARQTDWRWVPPSCGTCGGGGRSR